MLTQNYLKSILHYDPETGIFTRLKNNKITGQKRNIGYLRVCINNKAYLAHRLAWLYMYGHWPIDQIDHINHDRSDNRIYNLREVNRKDNNKNASIRKDNTSGITGVSWVRKLNKWRVQIDFNNKKLHVGVYSNLIDASLARKEAEKNFNYHINHGSILNEK